MRAFRAGGGSGDRGRGVLQENLEWVPGIKVQNPFTTTVSSYPRSPGTMGY